ncbi:hypothetical protein A6C57_01175 [Fibrella sp. ES10-3-2-2]|nr:hypothetical protein A6C57_01175 [Fibrella sp. ES10-3-2-2]
MSCATQLAANILVDCDTPLVRGVAPKYYLCHRSEIDIVTYAADGVTVSAFTMKSGKKLKQYEGIRYSTKPSVGFSDSEYGSTLPQTLELAIFSNGPIAKKEIHAMKGALDLVAIVQRNAGDWEMFGLQTGMRMSNFSQDANDETQKGAYIVTLLADAATKLPYTLRHETTGVLDTDTFLAGLALT